jgi:hypothetical protein
MQVELLRIVPNHETLDIQPLVRKFHRPSDGNLLSLSDGS